jgi:hypothetical protein
MNSKGLPFWVVRLRLSEKVGSGVEVENIKPIKSGAEDNWFYRVKV